MIATGTMGTHGIMSIVSYTLPGIVTDIVFLFSKNKKYNILHYVFGCMGANITGTLISNILFFRLPPVTVVLIPVSYTHLRIDTEEIKEYEQVEMDVVLINTTGTETKMHVKGPTLRHVLEKEGIDLSEYAGIGVTGRDGYYTLIDREKLAVNDIILTWQVNRKNIKDEDKPVRLSVPLELGPYWVKMVQI